MSGKTLKALKASIAHWKRLADGKARKDERVGRRFCALCKLFNSDTKLEQCVGCPVMLKTGRSGCVSTPYSTANNYFSAYGSKHKIFRAASELELEFLQSLLPNPPKEK